VTRLVLSFFLGTLVLLMGGITAFVQSGNYGLAGELDYLQRESESLRRRSSALSAGIARFEFEFTAGEDGGER